MFRRIRPFVFFFLLAIATTSRSSSAAPGLQSSAAPELPAILVSRQLLESEGLSVGDTLTLSGAGTNGTTRLFRVAGSYEPVADPMRITSSRLEARLHLPDLIGLTADPSDPLSSESVSSINVALVDPGDAAAFARDLSAKVPGLIIRPTRRPSDRSEVFTVLEQFHLAIALVTMAGSTAFLLALMVMFADERREAVGILRLLGVSKRRILLQVLAEGLLVAASGALVGILLAAACQGAFNRFFQWYYDTTLVFVRITPTVAWRCLIWAVPLGVLASLVASWTILRRNVLGLVQR